MKHFSKLSDDELEWKLHEMYIDMNACKSHINVMQHLLEKMSLSIKLLHLPNYANDLKEEKSNDTN